MAYDPPTQGADENFYGDYSSAYTYAAQAVEVEVDTETGQVRMLRVACAHDVGYAINPMGVRGQIFGGVAQGGGQGLYEDVVYENGKLRTTGLRQYNMMTLSDMAPGGVLFGGIHGPHPAPTGPRAWANPP